MRCATAIRRSPSRWTRCKAEGATRILVLPAYPQYSATTTASVIDAVGALDRAGTRRVPELRFVNHYHDDRGYIDALAASVQRALARQRPRPTSW